MNAKISTAGAVHLAHLGVIRARGADATKFLQSQLTNDIAALRPGAVRLAGFCSAKGRLQASFIVWKSADDDVALLCATSLLAATLKRLSMFVLRAQCKLSDATAEMALQGLVGTSAQRALADVGVWETRQLGAAIAVRLPDAAGLTRCIVAGLAETAPGAEPIGAVPALGLDEWRWLEVQSGIPLIEAATVDQFVPQMLNFELLGGVDFQKGCYPGQEVVARSQYRGTIKRRMFLFDCDVAASAGQEVFQSADPTQPAGMVVNAAPNPGGGWSALVEAKLAAVESGNLQLASVDGAALRPAPLPYALA